MEEQKIFRRFPDDDAEALSRNTSLLYREQQKVWPLLRDGVAALDSVQTRTVDAGEFSVRLQFNPQRIVSSGAKVDAASIRARRCFLCIEHLPAEQQGILYRESYLVLCNPMPIFREHFTIAHRSHIPQSVEESILTLLDLAKDFSATHTVFYNGPQCGASAPDHLHFQACPTGTIPAEREAFDAARRSHRRTLGAAELSLTDRYGREVILLEGELRQDLELGFLRLMSAMRRLMRTNDEPMVNVVCSYSGGRWRMMIFPRSKHRPDVYFKEGDERVLISPAAVDMGGLIITPLEKDYTSVDASLIRTVFAEVSIPRLLAEEIVHAA